MPKNIQAAVGAGGMNRYQDAATVQYLLNCVPESSGGPAPELAVDGVVGPLTLAAIQKFQLAQTGQSDRRVDPLGPTLHALQSFDPYPEMPMPSGVTGGKGAKSAGTQAAAYMIVKTVTAAVAGAAAKSAGVAKTPGGYAQAKSAALAHGLEETVRQAGAAAAKALEGLAKQAAKWMPEGGSSPDDGFGPGGLADAAQRALEAAKRTAEAVAKQAGIPVPPGGFELPTLPGVPGGPFDIGELARKAANAAAQAAKSAVSVAEQAGKYIPPSAFDFPPGGGTGTVEDAVRKAAQAAAQAVQDAAQGAAAKGAKQGGFGGRASGKCV